MDKDRNAFHQAEGALRQAAGKITGNDKLKNEGYAMRETGKTQMGGTKDALRDQNSRRSGSY